MFGNAPRAVWERWCPPDELGRISLSCRAFLVEDGKSRVLVESGVGAFFPPKYRERYGVNEEEHVLLRSLGEAGFAPEDVDVVFLSHLHFDHAGGILSAYEEGQDSRLVFPRARYVVGREALERARSPHPRDRASFIPQLLPLLEASDRLEIVEAGQSSHPTLGERMTLRVTSGHTPGMLLPTLNGTKETATFCADLVPGVPWVHLPITMGYDRFPERLIDEKRELYSQIGVGTWLLFTHDAEVSRGRLAQDENGRFSVVATAPKTTAWDLDG